MPKIAEEGFACELARSIWVGTLRSMKQGEISWTLGLLQLTLNSSDGRMKFLRRLDGPLVSVGSW